MRESEFEYHGNGVASLFQEEQVLCGNGFLKKTVYKFAFELKFPAKSMPSTIDFERGTVSYMVSATVTRPVTMMPTYIKHKRIKFQDALDVEAFNAPKSRVITLEPMSRRGKVKKVNQTASQGTQDTSSRGHLPQDNAQNGTMSSATIPLEDPPLSPAPSDNTVATTATASSQSFRQTENTSPVRKGSPETSDARSSRTSTSAHTITATTELPRHGALPGDSIPVRVSVSHTKPYVKGVVIATLYRIGRVD
ncbi:MAG: ph-response sensor protein, partial [Watsoniomyces obsoletus]